MFSCIYTCVRATYLTANLISIISATRNCVILILGILQYWFFNIYKAKAKNYCCFGFIFLLYYLSYRIYKKSVRNIICSAVGHRWYNGSAVVPVSTMMLVLFQCIYELYTDFPVMNVVMLLLKTWTII